MSYLFARKAQGCVKHVQMFHVKHRVRLHAGITSIGIATGSPNDRVEKAGARNRAIEKTMHEKTSDRKKNALQRVRALERIAGAVSSQRRRDRAAEERLQRLPQPALQARRHSFSRSTTSKGVRAASMMSLLPNVHTASCATAAARGAASARTACASAAVISARVSRRASGVRPPK